MQLAIHVMGDHAIDQILEVLEGETDWLQDVYKRQGDGTPSEPAAKPVGGAAA